MEIKPRNVQRCENIGRNYEIIHLHMNVKERFLTALVGPDRSQMPDERRR